VKRELLEKIVTAQASGRAAVLIRDLSGNEPVLVMEDETPADSLPPELMTEASSAMRRDGARTLEIEHRRILIQSLAPPYRLVVVGAVHIAQALIPMARLAGYDVELVDPRPAFATTERFPGIVIDNRWPQEAFPEKALTSRTAVVTLSHDAKIDEPALTAALQSKAFYIGALGSRKNHAKRLERLAEAGFGEEDLARISGPIGLPLGGRAPAEIAVSILAQMIQTRHT
jgi:xanthine dehydrogenase accessory factor